MKMMTLAQAHALLPGSVLVGDGSQHIQRVHSDTRSTLPGDLFVALRGERFDGHDHLNAAHAAGAVAALAEQGLAADRMPGLQVNDTLAALQQLAAAWRGLHHLPLVAVTGSNGKTTVTQMVAAIGRTAHGAAMLATAGNFNNHIGVPLTLLRLRTGHRAAVLELGMNHPGEIALLAHLAQPTVALVNNAQREHQEFMATVQAVARENGAVIEALAAAGSVVIPSDDPYTPLWREMAGSRRVLGFSDVASADISVTEVCWHDQQACWTFTLHTPAGSMAAMLRQAGRHNLRNALAACACALAAGWPLAVAVAGLAGFEPVAGRSQLHRRQHAGQPFTLVDDSYNANPDSVLAAIALLAGLPGPRWLVLGDMGEVGAEGPRFHAEVGAAARQAGIEQVWTTGALSASANAHRHFDTLGALLQALPGQRPEAASVLVKGSRFMQMEQVVQALILSSTAAAAPAAASLVHGEHGEHGSGHAHVHVHEGHTCC